MKKALKILVVGLFLLAMLILAVAVELDANSRPIIEVKYYSTNDIPRYKFNSSGVYCYTGISTTSIDKEIIPYYEDVIAKLEERISKLEGK